MATLQTLQDALRFLNEAHTATGLHIDGSVTVVTEAGTALPVTVTFNATTGSYELTVT
jgi:hypothetical protein